MTHEAPVVDAPVLSTLRDDGTRRWLYPRVSPGRFWRARRWTAYVLIGIFTLLPYIRIGGKPAVLLDIPHREFTFFGFTFLPTDTLLLALFLVTFVVGIFLLTALAGRIWCGWICPQTVYLEFVYRPIERIFDGAPRRAHQPGTKRSPVRTVTKYAAYLLISAFLAHTFLAYFVGVDQLAQWVRQSPLEHPLSFFVMVATTGLMMFDFAYFREQTCILACPYGRFQSVMLDRDSLIISYDARRGEPRGRRTSGESVGDCIDCGLCTDTCPTGIDIRDGLQMECIACAQCIDACDKVMDRLGKPRGLIRYTSQARLNGAAGRWFRPRVLIYPAVMLVLLSTFVVVLAGKREADVTLLRGLGTPYTEMTPGRITNRIRIKIRNRTDQDAAYQIQLINEPDAELTMGESPFHVSSRGTETTTAMITLPRSAFQTGHHDVTLQVSEGDTFSEQFTYRLLGPQN